MAAISPELARELPPTLDALIAAVEAAPSDDDGRVGPISYVFAERADAIYRCDVCGRPIIEVEPLVEAILEHYGAAQDPERRLEGAIRASHLEVGDKLSPNYCSEHAQITSE
jgi:hypothetical protein